MAAEKQRLSRTMDIQPKTEGTLKILEEVAPLDEALYFEAWKAWKAVADKPDFEVVLEDECPIQRAEAELEITNVVKASREISKKERRISQKKRNALSLENRCSPMSPST